MIIALSGSASPTDQIHDQIRGLIVTGRLAADERLPSVRQLAKDLGVAPGTVAKAYRALETGGFLVNRAGSGSRVSSTASTTPLSVLEAANRLSHVSTNAGTDLDDTIRILRAIWPNTSEKVEPPEKPGSLEP